VPTLIDSYSESNQSYVVAIGGTTKSFGQGFTVGASDVILDSAKFYLAPSTTPTGSCYAKVYSHTGTWGSSGTPDVLLATSDAYDAATIPTGPSLITFTFSGAERVTLTAATHYFVVLVYTSGDAHRVNVYADGSSPTHGGNAAHSHDLVSWTAQPFDDVCFYLYADAPLTLVLADTITLEDDNAGEPVPLYLALDDTIALSDGLASAIGHHLALDDAIALSEQATPDLQEIALYLALADSISLSDQWRPDLGAGEEIPPVFPIPPAGERILTHGYLTDVIGPAEDGHEQRVQLRRVPVHGMEFEWADGGRESQLLASLLYRQELQWTVPFWPGLTRATQVAPATATKVYIPTGFWATSLWALWALEAAAGALYVVLWRDPWTCEAQRYTGHGSDGGGEYVTLAAGLAAGWPAGTVVLPATLGYLLGETPRERLTPAAKRGRVALRSLGVIP